MYILQRHQATPYSHIINCTRYIQYIYIYSFLLARIIKKTLCLVIEQLTPGYLYLGHFSAGFFQAGTYLTLKIVDLENSPPQTFPTYNYYQHLNKVDKKKYVNLKIYTQIIYT